jgi:hypothetical protein
MQLPTPPGSPMLFMEFRFKYSPVHQIRRSHPERTKSLFETAIAAVRFYHERDMDMSAAADDSCGVGRQFDPLRSVRLARQFDDRSVPIAFHDLLEAHILRVITHIDQ